MFDKLKNYFKFRKATHQRRKEFQQTQMDLYLAAFVFHKLYYIDENGYFCEIKVPEDARKVLINAGKKKEK